MNPVNRRKFMAALAAIPGAAGALGPVMLKPEKEAPYCLKIMRGITPQHAKEIQKVWESLWVGTKTPKLLILDKDCTLFPLNSVTIPSDNGISFVPSDPYKVSNNKFEKFKLQPSPGKAV